MLIVISGPSGVGKGTVIKELLSKDTSLTLSISYTTRAPRKGETNGKDYHFVSVQEFEKFDMLEWAEVHGKKYGTPNIEYPQDTVFEVDIQGAEAIKTNRPDSLTVFLLPPSPDVLEKRLIGRDTEAESDIKVRMTTAKKELKRRWEADYQIVNDKLEDTVNKISEVIKLEKLKRKES